VLCVHEGAASAAAHHWHHIIGRQRLHRYVLDQQLLPIEAFALERALIHDERNLLPICATHHLSRKGGLDAVIPIELLPGAAWAFAHDLGLEYVLEKQYAPAASRDPA